MIKTAFAALSLSLLPLACVSASAQRLTIGYRTYQIVTFDVPGAVPGPSSPSAPRLSNLGTVVGYYADSSGHFLGWEKSLFGPVVTGLKDPHDNLGFTRAYGINDFGEIVGAYLNLSDGYHGFTLKNGVYTTYDLAGTTQTQLAGINNFSDLVGFTESLAPGTLGKEEAFLVQSGKVTTLFYMNDNTYGQGLNNLGEMVGIAVDAQNNSHSFYRSAQGAITPIVVPNAVSVTVDSINDLGEVAGQYLDNAGNMHGFLHNVHQSAYYTIDIPGAKQTFTGGLNDFGMISGHYLLPNGAAHAYILIPIL